MKIFYFNGTFNQVSLNTVNKQQQTDIRQTINNYPAKSLELAKIRRYSERLRRIIVLLFKKIVNETRFADKKTVIMQCFTRLRTNLPNLRISQDICYVQMW